MSHRKYSAPRCGHLGYLPRKRCTHYKGQIRSFPKDDATKKPHFTAFLGYKAGCTHVVRDVLAAGAKSKTEEQVQGATIIDCPAMTVVGVVAYIDTTNGLRTFTTAWAEHLSESFRRRMYKNWYNAKKKAFTKHAAQAAESKKTLETELARMKRVGAPVIRVIAHTKPEKTGLKMKAAHIIEIQINGGSTEEKVDFAAAQLEQDLHVGDVIEEGEFVDAIGVTKGHGFEGVIKRWGVRVLPRKTMGGTRKVSCIGAWHPMGVQYSVARAGQTGFNHRTEINKQVLRIADSQAPNSGSTAFDTTEKTIQPMGGYPHYGLLRNEFVMIKGSCMGVPRRPITLRKAMKAPNVIPATGLKWIATGTNQGHGCNFQTSAEKAAFYGKK
ncbi:ribosomal protein L3 [Kipferlia bialata]|uniref:Ribosomal protein L3 n=1 Tax=Kipferlia bialata TaxID=797122 RepID=A0A391NPL2_9EUKA|nr:ribosomal protein L3 [Kipferlia bialata]|eukprot:g10015.t1